MTEFYESKRDYLRMLAVLRRRATWHELEAARLKDLVDTLALGIPALERRDDYPEPNR